MVGSPGLRGSPWTRSSQRDQSHLNGKAGQGAVRGPGVRPTIFADRPVMGKTSGIGLIACDLAGYQPGVVNLRPIVSQIVNRPACEVAKAACSG